MALSARDYYFAVRVEDRASRPLRGIANNLRALSQAGRQYQAEAKRLQVAGTNLRQQRQLALMERNSLTMGRRNIEQRLRAQRLSAAETSAITRRAKAEENLLGNQAQRMRQLTRLQQMEAVVKPGGTLPRMDRAQSERALKAARIDADRLAAAERRLKIEAEQAQTALSGMSLQAQKVAASEVEAAQRAGYLTARIQALNGALVENKAAQAAASSQIARLPLERFQMMAHIVQNAGRAIRNFGAIATGVFAVAANKAADFQNQIMLAATQARPVGAATGVTFNIARQLDEQVRKALAGGQMVGTAEELSKSLYEIFSGITLPGSLNQQLKEGTDLMQQFNRVAKANYGLVDFAEVTKLGIVLLNTFNVQLKDMPKALNTAQAAVRFGKMNMSEFIGTFGQAAPAARAAGYSFEQMAASIAFLSRMFPTLGKASAGYARLTEILANPKTVAGLKKVGIQATDTSGNLLPLDQVIANIIKRYPDLAKGGVALQGFFKQVSGQTATIQARRAFTFFIRQAGLYRQILRQVAGDRTELDNAEKAASRSPAVRWRELRGQLEALALSIGEQAIPAFAKLSQPIQRLLHWFNNLSPATQKAIGYIGTFAAVGALLGGQLLALVGGAASLLISLRFLAGGFGGLGSQAGGARLGVIGLLLTLVILATRSQTAMSAVGGLRGMLELLGVVIGALTLARLINSIVRIGLEAQIAAGSVGGLRMALLGLPAVVATSIGVDYEIIKHKGAIEDLPFRLHNALKRKLGPAGFLVGGYEELPGDRRAREAMTDYLNQLPAAPGQRPGEVPFLRTASQAEIARRKAAMRQARQAASTAPTPPGPRERSVVTMPIPALHRQLVFRHGQWETMRGQRASAQEQRMAQQQWENTHRIVVQTGKAQAGVTQQVKTTGMSVAQLKRQYDSALVAEQTALKYAEQHPQDRGAWKRWQQAAKRAADAQTAYATGTTKAQARLEKQMYDKMIAAQEKAARTGTAADKKAARESEATQKKAARQAAKTAKDSSQQYQSILSQLTGFYQQALAQNQQALGQIGGGPFFQQGLGQALLGFSQMIGSKFRLPFKYVQKDLDMQVDAFARYERAIKGLVREKLPIQMVQQLQQLGVQGTPILEAIVGASPQARAQYIKRWKEGQKLIQEATKADTDRQVKQWRQFGKDVAGAILKGIQDQDKPLRDYLRNVVKSLIKGTPLAGRAVGAVSAIPPDLRQRARRPIPVPPGAHPQRTRVPRIRPPRVRRPRVARAPRGPRISGVGPSMAATLGLSPTQTVIHHHNFQPTIHAHTNENVEQVLSRTHFRWRNRWSFLND